MKKKTFLLLIIIFLTNLCLLAQAPKRKIEAIRGSTPIKIDGVLDEEIWGKTPIATDFIQNRPYSGEKASEKTEVRFAYDNNSLYVGAMLYDSPEDILKELSKRDDIPVLTNADFFMITLFPFNGGIDGYQFWVSAAGVQVDEKVADGNDGFEQNKNWDAVWKSKVNITDKGWIVEIEIPFSEIRFSKENKQTWGINAWKYTRRTKERSSFNFVDRESEKRLNQAGELHGIQNIKPPLRLSVTPYLSNSIQKNRETSNWKNKFGGGLDLKYGINESFTLDMMLIPDFTEVESDDQILNLSPFETKFEEKRQFFTEGTELFSKGDIFYSKRIGRKPSGHSNIKNALHDGTYKNIKENPIEASLINATKLSGRTNKGLGVGFFNAMTNNTYATVIDDNDVEREILTEPFTNYNMLVFDQTLKNNSYVSFMNTNVWKERNKYMANVTGTEFRLENKSNIYSINGNAIVSKQYNNVENDKFGSHLYWNAAKTKGNFRFNLSQLIETEDYDPNDMGYLQRNNKFDFNGALGYYIYKPFGKFLYWTNVLNLNQEYLYSPRKYSGTGIKFLSTARFKNYWDLSLNLRCNPNGWRDYFKSEVQGKMFRFTQWFGSTIKLSTDNRKMFSAGVEFNYGQNFGRYKKLNQYHHIIKFTPQLRINDKVLLKHDFMYNLNRYFKLVNNSNEEHIYFGQGKVPTISNTFTTSYIFNNKSALSFRMRHYWSRADYKNFFQLQSDGYVKKSDYSGDHDINYNAFNIDFVYSWRLAPGSELSVIWKTAVDEDKNFIRTNSFSQNFQNTLDLPSASSFSVKLLYYLDWQSFKRM